MNIVVPNHIAIIPDGNRRWAAANKKPAFMGHKAGAENAEKIIRTAFDLGVRFITIWGASEDNLKKRSKDEVIALTRVFIAMLKKLAKSKDIKKYNVRICVRGKFNEILKNKELQTLAKEIELTTKKNSERTLTILLGYDGKQEMLCAIKSIQKKEVPVTEESLLAELFTGFLPPVDLVIRTGGEPHWSAGFMMWHTANSEFYFTKSFWPEFSSIELNKACNEFAHRRRMSGA